MCSSNSSKYDMLLKIDLEKAFDKLEWDFIQRSLNFFNFPPKISKLIMHYISTSQIGILVNGTKKSFFSPSRGIHQGDSMFPYIFILCMELMSKLIDHQVDTLLWDPVKISPRGSSFSHLFFADDLTLIGKSNQKTGNCIKNCLNLFMIESGLSINYSKSRLVF